MKKILVILAIVLVPFISWSQDSYFNNQVIVIVHGQYTITDVIQTLDTSAPEAEFTLSRVLSRRAHVSLVAFNPSQLTVLKAIEILKKDERVSIVQPNHNNIKQRSTIPDDLEYPVQWSFGSTATARIFAPEAWDITTDGLTQSGDTIVMAVVDGGMELNHIDLNLFKNLHEIPNNGIDDDNNGYIDDYDGWNAFSQTGNIGQDDHGTHIAGIMAAKTNNTEGVAGIVWGGKILPIEASSTNEAVVIEGYGYALELRSKYNESNGDSGAFVVVTNSSFGVDYGDPANYPAWCAFYDSLGAAGILNLAATSNSGINVDLFGDIPTTCPSNYMIAVSNINSNGNLLGGYGATQIDLAAPGTDIRSTELNNGYGFKTGTSMATPHVAGVIGAMYSAMCGFDLNQARMQPDSLSLWVRQRLLESVDTVTSLDSKNITSGRLNMYKAVRSMQTADIEISYSRYAATGNTIADGSIDLNPTGGTNPYTYQWSNGETSQNISGLLPGTYSVTVTEKFACVNTETIDIWTLGISDIANIPSYVVAPNPNNGSFQISFEYPLSNLENIEIFDEVGKRIYTQQIPVNSSGITITTALSKGIYFVRIGTRSPAKMVVY